MLAVKTEPTPDEKIQLISVKFAEIMEILGLDLDDESLSKTPMRVGKMMVNELFKGLNPANKPVITTFPNDEDYETMLLERDIRVVSVCEHHFVPIIGKCHIAYIPGERVIGLSKFHRIVDWFGSRPSLQERLTQQIGNFLIETLETDNVSVIVDAVHHCCNIRGVKDFNSSTVTSFVSGKFKTDDVVRKEMLELIKL